MTRQPEEPGGRTRVRAGHRPGSATGAVALCALLALVAGCGRSVPDEYGMYVYDGRKPVPLERGTYRSVESEPEWLLNFVESSAREPASPAAEDIAGVDDPARLELLVHFQNLQAANVHVFRTEYDLFVTDIVVVDDYPEVLKRSLFESRRDVMRRGMPSTCLDTWLMPIDAEMWPFGRTHWKPSLQGGNAVKGLFREANHRDNEVALLVAPVKGTPDAFILTPRQELEPGVYLMLVRGENAGVITQGQGGALFRVGPRQALRGAISAGVKAATENLNRHDLGDLPKGRP